MFNSELLHQFCNCDTTARRAQSPASSCPKYSKPRLHTEKRPPVHHTEGRNSDQSIGLKLNAAPSLIPDGQREVMVFVRV